MSNLVTIKKTLSDPKALTQFKLALPDHIEPQRFQRVALTAIMNSPDLASCSQESVFNSLMKCAQDGLMPDNKEAALVKFGSTAQYMPMVYGLIKRMRNSGEVSSVNAHIVYEHDEFQFEIVDGTETFRHKPKLIGERGQIILAYCIVKLKDGSIHVETMTKNEIDKVRAVSKSKDGPAWKNWYDEMAKKTVIHRAAKRVPTSSDIERLIQRDVRVTMGEPEEEEVPKTGLIDSINEAIDMEVTAPETDTEEEGL